MAEYRLSEDGARKLIASADRRLAWLRAHSGKTCTACKQVKPLAEFGPDYRARDGLQPGCKQCDATRKRPG